MAMSAEEMNAAIEQQFALLGGGGGGNLPQPIGVPAFVLNEQGQPVPFAAPGAGPVPESEKWPGQPEGWHPPMRAWQVPMVWPNQPPVPPRYFEGHERVLGLGMSVEEMAELQRKMFDAGLYSPEEARVANLGIWAEPDWSAAARLLGFANQSGLKAMDALPEYAARTKELGGLPGGGALKTNPADIRAIAIEAGKRRWGTVPSDQQLKAFEAAYHQAIDAPPDELGMAAPDPAVFAEQQLDRMDPAATTRHAAVLASEEWFGALESPVG